VEDYDKVNMELDLKEWMAERWAGINFWEQHVEWDFET
jgi:hypothetical protein